LKQFNVPGSWARFVAAQLATDVWKLAFDVSAMSAASTQAPVPASPPPELEPESVPPSLGLLPLLPVVVPLLLVVPPLLVVPLLLLVLLPPLPPLLLLAPSPVLLPLLFPDSESVMTPASGLPPEVPLEPHA
jgi:hypothetical protein